MPNSNEPGDPMSASPSRYFFARERQWQEAPDGVLYTAFATAPDDPARPLVILSRLPPHHCEPPHTHGCDYIEVVLSGDLRVGKVDLATGDVRVMKAGAGYGPLVSGPDGCLRLTIFESAAGSPMTVLGAGAPRPA